MTIHLVPSFLVIDQEYFDDRRDGMSAMDSILGGFNQEYVRAEPRGLPIGPEWQARRRMIAEQAKVEAIERALGDRESGLAKLVQRYQTPQV